MADNSYKVKNSLNIKPSSSAGSNPAAGDIRADSTDSNKPKYHDGSTEAEIITATSTSTLTNKTLTAPVINSPTGLAKADVGLGNVDNTSDATKNAATVALTNKTIDATLNTVSNVSNAEIKAAAGIALNKLAATTASKALTSDASGFVSASSVTSTELGYVSGVTSAIQTQINTKAPSASPTFTGTVTTPLSTAGPVLTSAGGVLSSEAQLAIARGGTGQSSANAALNAFLPSQTSNSGKALTTDGSNTQWTSLATNPMNTGGDLIYGGSSGTPTRLANGTAGQYLQSTGGTTAPAWTSFSPVTVQNFLSTGTTTGWLFTISTSTTCAVNDTYTNNGNTYTVLGALSTQSGQVLFMSGANSPLSSGTLTRSSGAGTSSVTFTATQALATYTTPANTLWLKVRLVGAGGGGGGSGTGSTGGTGGTGGATTFGVALLKALGGAGGHGGYTGTGDSLGGQAAISSPAVALVSITGTPGNSAGGFGASASTPYMVSGSGGCSPFGGAGAATAGGAASAALANSGSGGGGGGVGGTTNSFMGSGGAAGGYIEAIITSPSATYYYTVGAGGSADSAGTSGNAGGAGGSGRIIVEEHYS